MNSTVYSAFTWRTISSTSFLYEQFSVCRGIACHFYELWTIYWEWWSFLILVTAIAGRLVAAFSCSANSRDRTLGGFTCFIQFGECFLRSVRYCRAVACATWWRTCFCGRAYIFFMNFRLEVSQDSPSLRTTLFEIWACLEFWAHGRLHRQSWIFPAVLQAVAFVSIRL